MRRENAVSAAFAHLTSFTLLACAALFVPAALLAVAPVASAGEGYLRHPDVHGDLVVFNAEEDLWTVPVGGGTAFPLTTHSGAEYFPRFSPDGATVAFTGEYDGNLDVYLVPVAGGEPERLTWSPGRDEVVGWTADGSEVLFRSRRDHPHGSWEMFAVAREGGDPRKLPIGRCARLAIDPVSGQWAINRLSREMSTWKRYRGGTNPDIWVGHPDRDDFRRVTEFSGWDAYPMWLDGRIYFLSDQGGTANLWSMTPDGTDRQRLTNHDGWDMRWPEMGPDGRIVYMLAGDLRLFDPATGGDRELEISLASESVLTRRRYPSTTQRLESADLSPDGERVAIVTRGEIFSVPVEEGVTLAVSAGSGAREKWASFDGEGEKILYVTDAPGEESIREIDAWGRGEPRTVKPAGETGWHFPPVASPDGEWIAWADQTQTLWVMKRSGGDPIRVDRSPQEEIREYTWSPDSRWLAYSRYGTTDFPSIYIYDTKENRTRAVTGRTTIDWSPAWDPDGRWLAFLSDRTINPLFGQRDFQNIEFRPTKPYLLLLKEDAKSPFRKDSGLPPDEEDGDKEKDKKKDKKKDDDEEDEKEAPEPVEIDWDGIEDRIVEVPMDAGIYTRLSADAGHLYMLKSPVSGMREASSDGPRASLVMYDLEDEEDKKIAGGVSAYEVEPGAKKLLFSKKRGHVYVIDAGSPAPDDLSEHAVSLDDVVIELHPREEWSQIYWEGWRHMRDFYWDENMAGVDWRAVGEQYATLLPRLAVRDDLRDLMGELIGELNTSHTYVWGGDRGERPETVPVGLLGAEVAREGDAYRIVTIYRGDPADETRAPLDAPDLDVKEGEYIVAVNRRPFPANRPFPAAFEKTSGRRVVLTIAANADGKDARDVVVTPTGSERRIRYVHWVREAREAVAAATDGKIGYIHLPNMGASGLSEFNRWFYPQIDKEGMVVDCRWNGGGFVSQMIVERFRRSIVSFDRSRAGGIFPYPYRTLNGPFVVLLNEEAGSDGDIFPYVCQYEGLAPVIGQRSWGGVVGIRGDKTLVDGGMLTQPEYAWWDATRGWAIENYGVDPDIVVANLPREEGRGIDTQLQRGIEEVLRLHAENPPARATFEDPIPDKSRSAYRSELE